MLDRHVLSLSFHPSMDVLCVAAAEVAMLWRYRDEEPKVVLRKSDMAMVRVVRFHPSGSHLIVGYEKKVRGGMHILGQRCCRDWSCWGVCVSADCRPHQR